MGMPDMNNPLVREVAKINMLRLYPYLKPDDGNSLVSAAKNIRIELKRAFPGVKFSVKTERFSMGDAARVSWEDGPNSAQVEEIISKYEAGSFDGSTDCYNYDRSVFKEIFGDAKYVSASRKYSDSLVASAIEATMKRYGGDPITVEDYNMGRAWRWMNSGGVDLGRELSVYLQKVSRALPAEKAAA